MTCWTVFVLAVTSISFEDKTHEEVVFGVLEDHVDRLFLEDDFLHGNHVLVVNLSVQLSAQSGDRHVARGRGTHCNFSYGTLTYSGIGDNITLLIGFELFNRVNAVCAILADGFVHASVRS